MPKKYWFRAKKTGIGWYPASWEGWLITIGYIVVVAALAVTVSSHSKSLQETMIFLAPLLFLLTVGLVWIGYKKGEESQWRK